MSKAKVKPDIPAAEVDPGNGDSAVADGEVADEKPQITAGKVAGLRVTARQAGFRRAGRAWSTDPTDVPESDFTDDQIDALLDDPMLIVEEIEIDAES